MRLVDLGQPFALDEYQHGLAHGVVADARDVLPGLEADQPLDVGLRDDDDPAPAPRRGRHGRRDARGDFRDGGDAGRVDCCRVVVEHGSGSLRAS
jgi:hypothetical protein